MPRAQCPAESLSYRQSRAGGMLLGGRRRQPGSIPDPAERLQSDGGIVPPVMRMPGHNPGPLVGA